MTLTSENLGKRFSREWIFRKLSLTFHEGIYAITGPNGSGKSTLMQILWGQVPPSAGTITYQIGTQTVPVEEVFKQVMIAAPYVNLIEEFTLKEIIDFHFSFKHARQGKSTAELLDIFELGHAKDKLISHFSSGMKQRLKLGLAFYSDVKMVFLDEPTTNLDKNAIAWYWHHFGQISQNCLVVIGSNLENEYPPSVNKVSLLDYK